MSPCRSSSRRRVSSASRSPSCWTLQCGRADSRAPAMRSASGRWPHCSAISAAASACVRTRRSPAMRPSRSSDCPRRRRPPRHARRQPGPPAAAAGDDHAAGPAPGSSGETWLSAQRRRARPGPSGRPAGCGTPPRVRPGPPASARPARPAPGGTARAPEWGPPDGWTAVQVGEQLPVGELPGRPCAAWTAMLVLPTPPLPVITTTGTASRSPSPAAGQVPRICSICSARPVKSAMSVGSRPGTRRCPAGPGPVRRAAQGPGRRSGWRARAAAAARQARCPAPRS